MLLRKKPLIFIPGFGGSKLCSIVPPPPPRVIEPKRRTIFSRPKPKNKSDGAPPPPQPPPPPPAPTKNGFINLNVFDKKWDEKYNLTFEEDAGLSTVDDIDVYDFGGVEGIRNLCEDCEQIDNMLGYILRKDVILNVYNYKYFDTLVTNFEREGYTAGKDMRGAPYDFRKIMIPEYMLQYFERLKALIEESVEHTRMPAVVVSHSIGSLIFYIFLVEYCTSAWKDKYIDKFISVAGPFGGSSIALKTLLSGLPKLSLNFLKDKYYNVIQKSSGMMLALPNVLGYNNHDIIVHDRASRSDYTLENYLELLPNVSQHVWQNNVRPHLESFLLNTEVDTLFVTSTDHLTERGYIYDVVDTKVLKEPTNTLMSYGDSVVPKRSLLFHRKNKLLFPNYRFHDFPGTEHTKVLHSDYLTRLIKACLDA